MSDKPLIQQALATDLSELLLQINPASAGSSKDGDQLMAALGFLKGFWQAIVREWPGVDRLRLAPFTSPACAALTYRMDKFYMLMRRYVNATFRLQARHGWSKEAVDGVNEILMSKTGPMTCVASRRESPLIRRYQERSVPTSLSTHLADLYLVELDKVLALPEVNSQVSSIIA